MYGGIGRIGALLVGMAVVGCASAGSRQLEGSEAEAKEFLPVTGKSLIYLYRDQTVAPTFRIGVHIDDESVGALDTKSFIVCVVDPGPHEIVSGELQPAVLSLETEPGALYFVWHEYGDMAFDGHTEFHLVDERQGRSAVDDLRLIFSACVP